MIRFLFSLFIITTSNQSLAAAECTNNGSCCEELNAFWQEHLSNDFLFESSLDVSIDPTFTCLSEQSRLTEGFLALYKMSSAVTTPINIYERTKSTSSAFYYSISKSASGFAETFPSARSIIISKNAARELSPANYAAVLSHESEHTNSTMHISCNHGEYNKQIQCDSSFLNNLGTPYSTEFVTLHYFNKMPINDLARKAVKQRMKYLIENMFNEVPTKGPDGTTPLRAYYDL